MNEFGIALLWCAMQVTALSLAAGLCYLVARRFSPTAGSLVTLTSLMVVIGLSLLAFSPWPQWSPLEFASDQTMTASLETVQADDSTEIRIVETSVSESENGTDKTIAVADPDGRLVDFQAEDEPAFGALFWKAFRNELRTQPVEAGQPQPWRWPALLGVLVLVGIGVGAVRLVLGWTAVRSYRRRSRPVRDPQILELTDIICAELSFTKPVELRQSMELVTAATVGWKRPLILLPSEWKSWNEQERRVVLAHEIAHITRNDFLAWICAQVGLVLHFYHPLVHWLAGRLRLEQELAADAAAAALSGGQQRYLTTLAEMALRQADRPVAWPARTFLPTRRTFLRRIEMLRDTKQLAVTTLSRGTRIATIGMLVLVGIAVAGLRNPGNSLTQTAQAERTLRQAVEQQSGSQETSKAFDLSYVPKDLGMMWAVRSADFFSVPVFAPLAKSLTDDLEFKKQIGVDVKEVEQFLMVMIAQGREPAMYLTMKKPTSFQKLIEQQVGTQVERQEHNGTVYYSGTTTRPMTYFSPNKRTLILADPKSIRDIIDAGKAGAVNASWLTAWKKVQNDSVAAVVNMEVLKDDLQQAMQLAPAGNPFLIVAPIYEQSKAIAFGADLDKQLTIKMIADCGNADNAGTVKDTVSAALILGENMLAGLRQQLVNQPTQQEKALIEILLGLSETFLKNAKVEQKESMVRLTSAAAGDTTAKLVAAMLPAVKGAREAARMSRARNNLKQIAIAFHNYHATYNHFPAAAVIGPDNKTPHSWRVALLPFMDQLKLYKQYNLNEPWDSPNNKKVLANMPDVYRDPHMDANSTNSAYYVLTGDVTVFNDEKGTSLSDIRDGNSNTILAVEAKRNIPWTKPADIPYDADPKKDLPKLGGFFEGGHNASTSDGRVLFLSENIDKTTLRALFTRDGGEEVGDF